MDEEEAARREAIDRVLRELEGQFEYNGQPNGPEASFEALPIDVFLRRPKPPYEELLGPAIVRGQRYVLGAATGEGKSTFLWWMIKALVTGGSFLGWRAPRPCRVLMLDAEQTAHDVERLAIETNTATNPNLIIVHVPDGLSLNSSGDERERLALILREGNFDVVVLDPLYKLHTGDPNDEREAKALMKLFDQWRTELNFALLIPAHMRKPQGRQREKDFTMHEIHGASAYLRGAETIMGLKLVGEGRSQLHFFKSRSPGLPVRTSWMLRYNRHTGFDIYESGAEKASRERDEMVQKVRILLEDAGGAGVDISTLMEETGRGKTAIFEMLKEIGADSMPMPGKPKFKLYLAPGVRPNQAEMDILAADDDEDDDE